MLLYWGSFMFKATVQNVFAALVLFLSLNGQAAYQNNSAYPIKPDPSLTPGQLCQYATRLRYPERIKYCERDVNTETKWQVIRLYVSKFSYNINPRNRMDFKIDHYIPLCMGGSNDVSNLWPQHEKVYAQTDPMEPLLCEKMSMGKLKQAQAIELIKRGKNDLSQIKDILAYANRL